MSSTITPNMNLIVPTVGQEPGPDYATDVNSSLTIIDQHDHSNGSGVQIQPSGLNINSNLNIHDNFLTFVGGITLQAQLSTPGVNTIYESGNNLYFVDGIGNNIQITANGGVAGTPGSIANLVAPASASYVAGNQTFVWQSNTNIAANMDFGAAIMRNLSPNSTFALTLQPPAALSNDYSITLPTLPPAQQIMTLDNSGNMSAPYTVDESTITISSNVIKVKDQGITATQIANNTITAAQIANATITTTQIASATILGSNVASSTIDGSNIVNDPNFNGGNARIGGLSMVVAGGYSVAIETIFGTIPGNGGGPIALGDGFTTSILSNRVTITFNNAFSERPNIIACYSGSNSLSGQLVKIISSSTTNCVVEAPDTAGSGFFGIQFMAIGKR